MLNGQEETKPPGAAGALVRIQLRRKDMDRLGHLNHSRYHDFFEEARVALVRAVSGPERDCVLRRVEVDYLHEVRYADGQVEIRAHVLEVGRSSIVVGHEMLLPDGTVAARNRGVLVAWDPASRRRRELAAEERTGYLGEDA